MATISGSCLYGFASWLSKGSIFDSWRIDAITRYLRTYDGHRGEIANTRRGIKKDTKVLGAKGYLDRAHGGGCVWGGMTTRGYCERGSTRGAGSTG